MDRILRTGFVAVFFAVTGTIVIAADKPTAVPVPAADEAAANRKISEQYDTLLAKSPWYRKTRLETECGGIDSVELKQQCIESINQAKPPAKTP